MAAQWGQADAAAYLIKVGADFRIFDRHDDSALHWAAYKGNVEIVGLLHHLGLPLDDADGYGQTPLHLASLRGNLGVCEYLLVDAVTTTKTRLDPVDKNQKRPVDLATEKGHRHIVQFLNRQRPVCERGVKAFVQDNMSLGACIRMCIAGEKARFPWYACGVVRAPSRDASRRWRRSRSRRHRRDSPSPRRDVRAGAPWSATSCWRRSSTSFCS